MVNILKKKRDSESKKKAVVAVINAIRHTIIFGNDAQKVRDVVNTSPAVFDGAGNCFIGKQEDFPTFHQTPFVDTNDDIQNMVLNKPAGVVLVDYLDDSKLRNDDGEHVLNNALLMRLVNGSRQTFFLVKDQNSIPKGMFVTAIPNYISYVDADITLRKIVASLASTKAKSQNENEAHTPTSVGNVVIEHGRPT